MERQLMQAMKEIRELAKKIKVRHHHYSCRGGVVSGRGGGHSRCPPGLSQY
jgi:phosphoenolpyruvate carboxylase